MKVYIATVSRHYEDSGDPIPSTTRKLYYTEEHIAEIRAKNSHYAGKSDEFIVEHNANHVEMPYVCDSVCLEK